MNKEKEIEEFYNRIFSDKGKEIKELYDEIYADIAIQFGDGDYIDGDDREALAKQIVEHLQEWGYRKADVVRKETAVYIYEQIRRYKNHADWFMLDKVDEIMKEYGVGVDE